MYMKLIYIDVYACVIYMSSCGRQIFFATCTYSSSAVLHAKCKTHEFGGAEFRGGHPSSF